jgi:hypothetical protein
MYESEFYSESDGKRMFVLCELIALRKQKHMTPKWMASQLGIAVSRFCNLEGGQLNWPAGMIRKYAEIVGLELSEDLIAAFPPARPRDRGAISGVSLVANVTRKHYEFVDKLCVQYNKNRSQVIRALLDAAMLEDNQTK